MTSAIPGELNADQEQERKRKKRGAIIKFSLAGVALLGIGAAATSAAWTDDAWFKGTASALDPRSGVELQGGLKADGSDLINADTANDAVDISLDADQLAGFVPDEVRDVTLYLHNKGTVPLKVTAKYSATGDVFSNPSPIGVELLSTGATPAALDQDADPSLGYDVTSSLAQRGDTTVTLRLTAPSWTNDDAAYFGKSGKLTVTFTGTTTGSSD